MSEPTDDDFVPPGASWIGVPSGEVETGEPWVPTIEPPPDPMLEHLDKLLAGMRAYIDQQDEARRVAMERRIGELDLWLGDFSRYYEGIFQELTSRIATLEARDGSEGYRQYLVAELRRLSADKSG